MSPIVQAILNITSLIPLSILLFGWRKYVREELSGTTLTAAGRWLLAALLSWILSTVFQSVLVLDESPSFHGISTRLNYLSLTLWLTPLVAVLGAKRPGVRFWNVFVIVPMLLMLNWPAFSAEADVLLNSPLDLEAPALMGFFLVILMVVGNYFGTILTAPALLLCGTLAFALCEFSNSLPELAQSDAVSRSMTTLLLAGSLMWAQHLLKTQTGDRQGWERVWLDFRDWFGILWTRRVMDRLNQTAATEQWSARLTLQGIQWESGLSGEQRRETEQKMDHAFRWILRRFVDESWIDRRLSNS